VLVPGVRSVAYLRNPTNPVFAESESKEVEAAARSFGVKLVFFDASDSSGIERAFRDIVQQRMEALFVSADGFLLTHSEQMHLMPATATANRKAALNVEGIKLEVLAAEAAGRQLELDEVRELPLIHVPGAFALAAAHARRSSDRRRGGFLLRHSLRQECPWQKPLKYHTWSRPTFALGRESMLTVRTTCFPTAYVDVNFAPHPRPRGLADQSGQIPARVLPPSHGTQKIGPLVC
jgi:hypothetical protein